MTDNNFNWFGNDKKEGSENIESFENLIMQQFNNIDTNDNLKRQIYNENMRIPKWALGLLSATVPYTEPNITQSIIEFEVNSLSKENSQVYRYTYENGMIKGYGETYEMSELGRLYDKYLQKIQEDEYNSYHLDTIKRLCDKGYRYRKSLGMFEEEPQHRNHKSIRNRIAYMDKGVPNEGSFEMVIELRYKTVGYKTESKEIRVPMTSIDEDVEIKENALNLMKEYEYTGDSLDEQHHAFKWKLESELEQLHQEIRLENE